MATKKKGCGFLIIALIILLVGGGIAAFLGMSAVSTGKEFTENLNKGKTLVTPLPLVYSPDEDGEATVWHITNEADPDLSKIDIKVTEKGGGSVTVNKPSGSSTIGNQYLVASFSVEKGKDYMVLATGVPAGETFRVSSISASAALSMLGKGFGAVGVVGIAGVLALIFGIIGLVKFLGSKKSEPTPPAA